MRKLGLIILAMVVALGVTGTGYAWWTDTLTLNAAVNTGHLTWIFVSPVTQSDTGPDMNARDLNTDIPWTTNPPANVGSCTGVITNDHLVTYTVSNAYPGYYDKLTLTTKNVSTMPIKVKHIWLHYDGTDYLMDDGQVITTPDNTLQLKWTGTIGAAVEVDATTTEMFELLVRQSVVPQRTYQFSITMDAGQTIEP